MVFTTVITADIIRGGISRRFNADKIREMAVKFPHTHYSKGKRVTIRLKNGERVSGRFVERKGRFVHLEGVSVRTCHIAHMGFTPKTA